MADGTRRFGSERIFFIPVFLQKLAGPIFQAPARRFAHISVPLASQRYILYASRYIASLLCCGSLIMEEDARRRLVFYPELSSVESAFAVNSSLTVNCGVSRSGNQE
ncbi:hypothetical protein [Nitrosospira sp. Nsp1]|uniref:hypothetical protein n=1 Tax=Nitrosospira sp. Nsp1 TaxID=136547 RepID=UPI00115FFAAC|nr:hypothetical protein [Nitrosospira sp. Nsp1]